MRSLRLALPGLGVFSLLWLIILINGDAASYMTSEIQAMWQSAGIGFLTSDPWGTLRVLHSQPPGMNALFAFDLFITGSSHAFLLGLYFVAVLFTIYLVVDSLRRVGAVDSWALTAGVILAVLPSTVIYAQWAYSVVLVAFFATSAVWGTTVMTNSSVRGVLASSAGIVGLILMRPSFTWPLLVLWCLGLAIVMWRRGLRHRVAVAGVLVGALVIVGGVQLYYFTSFGLPFMSSWSGENLAKALATSGRLVVTEGARAEIGRDPCMSSMLEGFEQDALNRWDWEAFRGLPGCADLPNLEPRMAEAWNSAIKPGTEEPNFIYSERLVTSRKWTQMMNIIVLEEPQQLLRMALTTDYGPRNSGLGIYLGPSEDYFFVSPIRDAHPFAVPLGLISLVFAPVLFLSVVVGWIATATARGHFLRSVPAFWFASGLLLYHVSVNTLFEYSENMRYRSEIDPVLLFAGVFAAYSVVAHRSSTESTENAESS